MNAVNGMNSASPETDCDEVVELVTEYLDGALDEHTRQRVEQHIEEDCDGCRRYLHQIEQTISSLGELPPENLPADAREALLTAFRR